MAAGAVDPQVLVQAVLELVARSRDGVFAVDADQRIVFWSDRMSAITARPPAEVQGRHCYDVLGGMDKAGRPICGRSCPIFAGTLLGRRPESFEMVASGVGERNLDVSVIPAAGAGGRAVLVHLVRDVSQRARSERLARMGITESELARGASAQPGGTLSKREVEVLRLIADGYTTPALVMRLGVSRVTVNNHVQNIFRKLGVHTRREAVREAARRGLL
ncbi:MAG TPA: LuxR C-terminal-related transcriptional regulator [Dehalococcoidia bacterium]|nr:LuxR C-terminal-related transcriptional regulator [Dehalococcoidia bacterium]